MDPVRLTLKQRRQRRRQIAKAVRSGRSLDEAAKMFGVGYSLVYDACVEAGLQVAKRNRIRQLHQQIVDAVRSGRSVGEAAKTFGVSYNSAYHACVGAGLQLPKPGPPVGWRNPRALVSREQWNAVDWTQQNGVIARRLGVSRERVRQMREALGRPKSRFHGQRGSAYAEALGTYPPRK